MGNAISKSESAIRLDTLGCDAPVPGPVERSRASLCHRPRACCSGSGKNREAGAG